MKDNSGRHICFDDITSAVNVFSAWEEFRRGKENKTDVAVSSSTVEEELFKLRDDLVNGTYTHSPYRSFYIQDPKLRHIHKPCVRDRVVHHAIHRKLSPLFEKSFIYDSYSSRKNKGTHRAVLRFKKYAWKLSQNDTKTVWVLQCDIKKFFGSIDHAILLSLLSKKVFDARVSALLEIVVKSFYTKSGKGIPLGNLTSQLFSNVYLNPLDHYVKEQLQCHYYIRYADDFLVVSRDRAFIKNLIHPISSFLKEKLKLSMHPDKVTIKRFSGGIDFLGYVVFPHHTILRQRTKKRILKQLKKLITLYKNNTISLEQLQASVASYKGMLRHCRGNEIEKRIDALILQQ